MKSKENYIYKKLIVSRVLAKTGAIEPIFKKNIIDTITDIYKRHKKTNPKDQSFPKELVYYMGKVITDSKLEQRDKLEILYYFKKNKMFNWNLNENLEKAWRLIAKRWGIPNYSFEN